MKKHGFTEAADGVYKITKEQYTSLYGENIVDDAFLDMHGDVEPVWDESRAMSTVAMDEMDGEYMNEMQEFVLDLRKEPVEDVRSRAVTFKEPEKNNIDIRVADDEIAPKVAHEDLTEVDKIFEKWEVVDSHSEETVDQLKRYLERGTIDDQAKNKIVEDITKLEQKYGTQIQYLDKGQNSVVFAFGDDVLKIGRPQVFQHPLVLDDIETIQYTDDLTIRVVPRMDTENMTFEELQYVYNQLRDSGYVWTDAHLRNIGRIPGSNGDVTGLRIIDDEKIYPDVENYSAFDVLYASQRDDLMIREYYYQQSINPNFKVSDIKKLMKTKRKYHVDMDDFMIEKYNLKVPKSELDAADVVIEWIECKLWNEKYKDKNVTMLNMPGRFPKLYAIRDEEGDIQSIVRKDPFAKNIFEELFDKIFKPRKDTNNTYMIDEEYLRQTGGSILDMQTEPAESVTIKDANDTNTQIKNITDSEFGAREIKIPEADQDIPGVLFKEAYEPNIDFVVVDETKMPIAEVRVIDDNIADINNVTLIGEDILDYETWVMNPDNYQFIEGNIEYMDALEDIFAAAEGEELIANADVIIRLMESSKYLQAFDVVEKIIYYVPDEKKKELVDLLLKKLAQEKRTDIAPLVALSNGMAFNPLFDTQSDVDFMEENVETLAKIIVEGHTQNQRNDTSYILNNVPTAHKEEMYNCLIDELLSKEKLTSNNADLLYYMVNIFDDNTLLTRFDDLCTLVTSESLVNIPHAEDYNRVLSEVLTRLMYIRGDDQFFLENFMNTDDEKIVDWSLRDLFAIVETEVLKNTYSVIENEKISFALQIYNMRAGNPFKGLDTPNMEKYQYYLSNFEDMSADMLNDFYEDVVALKFVNGIIPEECCDYIIRQKLNPDSQLERLSQVDDRFRILFKRAFEDRTRHELAKNGLYDVPVAVTEDDMSTSIGKALGNAGVTKMGNSYIEFSEEYVCTHPIKALDMMFHEVQHKIQYKGIDADEIEFTNQYRMLKECALRDANDSFYWNNYTGMYVEVDARYKARIKTKQYLNSIGADDIIPVDKEDMDYLNEYYKEIKKEQMIFKGYAIYKKKNNGKFEFVESIFNDYIKYNPNIIEKYPMLKLEYDSDGHRKPTLEILSDYDKKLHETYGLEDCDERAKALSELFAYNAILREQYIYAACQNENIADVVDLIEKDAELLQTQKFETDAAKSFRDDLIKNEMYNALKNKNTPPETREKIIKALMNFVNKNPDESISEEMAFKFISGEFS